MFGILLGFGAVLAVGALEKVVDVVDKSGICDNVDVNKINKKIDKGLDTGLKVLDKALEADVERDKRQYKELEKGIDDIFKNLE